MSESTFKQTGRIYKIGDFRKVSDSFSVQDFRIETDGQYPQKISFQLTQDRVTLIDAYRIGDLVTVHFDLRGKDYTDKNGESRNATNLNAWKIERVGDQSVAPTAMTAQSAPQAAPAPVADDSAQALFGDDDPNGDLPF
jgi:single-strand DNA-binding protein